jgi:hypothetical protein
MMKSSNQARKMLPLYADASDLGYSQPQTNPVPIPVVNPAKLPLQAIATSAAASALIVGMGAWMLVDAGAGFKQAREAQAALAAAQSREAKALAQVKELQVANQQIGAIAQDQANRIGAVKSAVCEGK